MKKTLGEKLQSVRKEILYGILLLCTAGPLLLSQFVTIKVPNRPSDAATDFFASVMKAPVDKPVIIQTDWTNSSRGESGGQFEALVRCLMRRGIKFAFYGADPQAPQVARDVIGRLNLERKKAGQDPYRPWDDWINIGYTPAVDSTNKAMATNLRQAFNGRQVPDASGQQRDIFQSPVLKGVEKFEDIGLFCLVTASNTSVVVIERLSSKKTPIVMAVTGVMGPETMVYYASKQIEGLSVGLKGVYDLETLMEYGLNTDHPQAAKTKRHGRIEGFPGQQNFGKGNAYYPTLHVALTLLILAVIVGNIGMMMTKRQAK